jgi:hypothetical protein
MEALARRQFLQFLAASPLLGLTEAGRLFAEETLESLDLPEHLIKSPADALDVFDFHNVAKQVLPTSHYGYLVTGTDGNETLAANREAFKRVYLRPMRMVDTSNVNLNTTLLNQSIDAPILAAKKPFMLKASSQAHALRGPNAPCRFCRTCRPTPLKM